MSLTPAFLDELRARTSLSALVAKTVKLTRAGREMKGCCPFHDEKTPSFYVNDDKGFYHCFGCSAHGDAIRWMTDQRGLPFIDAVKELAAAAGLEMPEQDRRATERAERAKSLHDVMQAAADWFTAQLGSIEGAEARALLERRGISDATRRTFGFGFAPDARGRLRGALKDYGDAMLVEAGLLIQVEGKEPYDRFRGRLMIPIRDPRGRVIAFGGRIIGDGEPKYLNSPDTPLFDKGRTLYNLDRAAPAARKTGRLFVVEGYMDAIALAQGGIEEVVAPLGTALTEHQLERLWRVVDVPILCLDGDAAGQKAALRAAHRSLPLLVPGRSLAFVTLPGGQDPDDLVRSEGRTGFENASNTKLSLSQLIWRSELSIIGVNSGPDERATLRKRLLDHASAIGDGIVRSEYRETFRELVAETFHDRRRNLHAVREAANAAPKSDRYNLLYSLHRAILLGLMRHPQIIPYKYEDIQRIPITHRRLDLWRTRLLDIMFDFSDLSESLVDAILAESDVAPIERRNYIKDLAFSFYRKSADPIEAKRDLTFVIELLVEEHESRQAVGLAQGAFRDSMTAERFAEQQRAMSDAKQFADRLAEWLEAAQQEDENREAS